MLYSLFILQSLTQNFQESVWSFMKEVYQLIESLGHYIVLQGTFSSFLWDFRRECFSETAEIVGKHYVTPHLLDWKRELLSVEPVEFATACPFLLSGKGFSAPVFSARHGQVWFGGEAAGEPSSVLPPSGPRLRSLFSDIYRLLKAST